eukprot:CAMPEP_0119400396 /NCGR_PEP_ID=MMETSP1334-20130426/141847_1 /TAXON_ID=127549 /ORGANISM="Calcidiscus leptoporus, Strain RCC1130" /LENGTH=115 /DNA_ID=CAMNT_0007424303 /DNA_START=490 /DNA_END=837 /DNA_ORIENTATION=+
MRGQPIVCELVCEGIVLQQTVVAAMLDWLARHEPKAVLEASICHVVEDVIFDARVYERVIVEPHHPRVSEHMQPLKDNACPPPDHVSVTKGETGCAQLFFVFKEVRRRAPQRASE